uniref:Putative secreted protein n=1 Tax=Panstrongylus lignarius TaxID=156445 RepID=A0A224XVU5_9HEMI
MGDEGGLLAGSDLIQVFIALTVTLAEICELAVEVVNSSCCTISTENFVRPSLWPAVAGEDFDGGPSITPPAVTLLPMKLSLPFDSTSSEALRFVAYLGSEVEVLCRESAGFFSDFFTVRLALFSRKRCFSNSVSWTFCSTTPLNE